MDGTLALSLRLEILGLTLLVWLGIYFFVNKRPVDSQRRLNSDLPIDRSIPFIPQLALVYFSTYIFVLEPFFILNKPRQFWGMLVSFCFHHCFCQFDSRLISKPNAAYGESEYRSFIREIDKLISTNLQTLW